MIGHFGNESISCAGADNEKVMNQTKHASRNQKNTKACPVKH